MLSFAVVQSSESCQSFGSRSITFVCHVRLDSPEGSDVTFFPLAKSSIKMPIALATKAFELDPMGKSV